MAYGVWWVYGVTSIILAPNLSQWGMLLTPCAMLVGCVNLAFAATEQTQALGDGELLAGNPPILTCLILLTSIWTAWVARQRRRK